MDLKHKLDETSMALNQTKKIKDELQKNLVLGIQARPPIGIILGFVGYSYQVIPLMQVLSHGTRAFIANAKGLPGFVQAVDVVKFLKEADVAGHLEHAREW